MESLGPYLIVLRKRFAMTLNILGIAVEEADNQQPECKANPIDQFWLAASDVLIEIVQRQPQIQPIIDAAIDAGGDIEITAHNQGGKISFALAEPSGLRHVLLADARQLLQPWKLSANVSLWWSNPAITPFGWEFPVNDPMAGASFGSGETTLMPVDPSECRQHALDCVRLAQTANSPEARKIWSDLARTWLMFATDLEANKSVFDEWGRPKPKGSQTGEWQCHLVAASNVTSLWSKSTTGVSGWQVVQGVIAGKQLLENGADLRLMTLLRCEVSKRRGQNDKGSSKQLSAALKFKRDFESKRAGKHVPFMSVAIFAYASPLQTCAHVAVAWGEINILTPMPLSVIVWIFAGATALPILFLRLCETGIQSKRGRHRAKHQG